MITEKKFYKKQNKITKRTENKKYNIKDSTLKKTAA